MNSDILKGSKAIAAWLGISERTIRHQVSNGRLPIFRIGAAICARKSTLTAWIADQERLNAIGRSRK
jgi:excisionase family DNA binding protein